MVHLQIRIPLFDSPRGGNLSFVFLKLFFQTINSQMSMIFFARGKGELTRNKGSQTLSPIIRWAEVPLITWRGRTARVWMDIRLIGRRDKEGSSTSDFYQRWTPWRNKSDTDRPEEMQQNINHHGESHNFLLG